MRRARLTGLPPLRSSLRRMSVPALTLLVCAPLLWGGAARASSEPLFAAPFLSFDTGKYPHSVAIGDVNADGMPDLVTANGYPDSTVFVLLGNEDGSFGVATGYGTGNWPSYSVVLGDLSGDGKPDLVAVNGTGSTVSVLLGNGDGTFGAKTVTPCRAR